MGIVRRQGAKHSIVQYVGVAIGGISTLFIYPLNQDLYGFAQFLIGTALLIYPLCNLGIHMVVMRYFPRFSREEDGGHAFFRWALFISVMMFALVAALFIMFKASILSFLEGYNFSESHLLENYYHEILTLTLMAILVVLLRAQSINYRRIVVPSVLSEFSLKLFLPVVILLSLFVNLGFRELSLALIIYNISVVILMAAYLFHIGAVSLQSNQEFSLKKAFFNKETIWYSMYSSLSRMGSLFAFRIDAFMITLILGAASNGLYYVILFIANVIEIPFRSLNQISVPLITKAWEDQDLGKISSIYSQTARTLTLVSLCIFLFLWWSLPDILLLSPKSDELQVGVQLFLFLGLAKVANSITSVNEPILNYSRHYRFGLYFVLFLGISNIFLNYHLINIYGLVGAAMATCISYLAYNLIKLLFIYLVYGIHPWSRAMTIMFLLAIACTLLQYPVQWVPSPFLRVLFNGTIILLLFLLPSIVLRLSPDFNGLLRIIFGKLPIFGQSLQRWITKYI
ncbi:MAG: polysaccharide biosynthesis C-terminal domain-containing protein [Saprospiraceae bacterium]|nr:polysaccharide biosynthesis C-terminal domain-containing protein [Saprospiraceae bacterium]